MSESDKNIELISMAQVHWWSLTKVKTVLIRQGELRYEECPAKLQINNFLMDFHRKFDKNLSLKWIVQKSKFYSFRENGIIIQESPTASYCLVTIQHSFEWYWRYLMKKQTIQPKDICGVVVIRNSVRSRLSIELLIFQLTLETVGTNNLQDSISRSLIS